MNDSDPRETIRELEWIIGTDRPERVAERLGYSSVDSLERVLYRAGRDDLVARLNVHKQRR